MDAKSDFLSQTQIEQQHIRQAWLCKCKLVFVYSYHKGAGYIWQVAAHVQLTRVDPNSCK